MSSLAYWSLIGLLFLLAWERNKRFDAAERAHQKILERLTELQADVHHLKMQVGFLVDHVGDGDTETATQ